MKPDRDRRRAGAAQGAGRQGDRRAGARDRRRDRVLERDRTGAAPCRGRASEEQLDDIGVGSQIFPGDLLAAPSSIRNKENRGLRVFTPFWRRVQSLGDPPKPLPAPKKLNGVTGIASDRLESWKLEPSKPDWAGGLRDHWTPGEASARKLLKSFLRGAVTSYTGDRDRPDRDGTSRLSPHLRFGEISPRQVWHASHFVAAEHPRLSGGIEKFLSELGWREFCRHLLFDIPDLATRNLQSSFDDFPWKTDNEGVARVAARPDRLSHRRCRHARTLAHRRDAQPRAHGGGLVPGQASPDRLASRRTMVLGHARRCRRRQQPRQLAMGGRLRRRCRALLPRVQSDPSGREVRS